MNMSLDGDNSQFGGGIKADKVKDDIDTMKKEKGHKKGKKKDKKKKKNMKKHQI